MEAKWILKAFADTSGGPRRCSATGAQRLLSCSEDGGACLFSSLAGDRQVIANSWVEGVLQRGLMKIGTYQGLSPIQWMCMGSGRKVLFETFSRFQ